MKLLILLFKSKVLLTSLTMLLSIFAYSLVFGWQYAVGFVFLLFVHEMGHYMAARQRGLAVGAPAFIPFVGAWIQMKEMPVTVEVEAYVGLAGPLVGSIGALMCYFAARATDSGTLLAVAYSGLILNLFNLIPVSPLDGGRVTAALSPRIWLLGAPILAALFFYRPSPLLILIAVLALPQLRKALGHNPDGPGAAYYAIPGETRLGYALAYLTLVGFLAVMANDVHGMLQSLRATGGPQ